MKFCQSRTAVHADAAALTNEAGESDLRAFDRLARVLADAQSAGCAPVLILSAAGARQAETAVACAAAHVCSQNPSRNTAAALPC